MAIALGERKLWGLSKNLPQSEPVAPPITKTNPQPLQFTETEITQMLIAPPPPELSSIGRAETPVGIWIMDEGIPVFDSKNADELNKITIEETWIQAPTKTKLSRVRAQLSKILMMSEPISQIEKTIEYVELDEEPELEKAG